MTPQKLQETRNKEIEEAREQELKDVCEVMSTPAGRRYVWRLLEHGNIFRSCFTGNSHTFYQEGIRESHLKYYQDIMEACPDKFWLTQKENIPSK